MPPTRRVTRFGQTATRPFFVVAFAALALACGDDDPEVAAPVELRVAHLSPDAPAVDVCLAPAGSGRFTGPVLEQAGAAGGLSYGQATRYLSFASGSYDVRVVAANATDCTSPIVPDTSGATLTPGRAITVAATGLAAPASSQPAFALVPLVDDTQVAAGKAKVRFVHASPGTPPVDVGAGSGASFTPIFTAVPFPSVDADRAPNGYVETDPLAGATLSARAAGTTEDALVVEGVTLPAGAIVTVFAVGLAGGEPPLAALVCADDTAETSLLSECALVP
jgi:hypothetical protein